MALTSASVGRPSILVPLPGALDQDQLANATALATGGGAVVMPQSHFTPASVAALITRLAGEAGRLEGMAQAARAMGRADAAERLAALVVATGSIHV